MRDIDPLENIVVEISRDGKTGMGTGFYISKDEIATCYHVLEPKDGELKNGYWIKREDGHNVWQEATVEWVNLPEDVAVLKTSKQLESFDAELRAWNNIECKFISRGYIKDASTKDIGATQIEGQIKTKTWIYEGKSRRLQLQTAQDTIKKGRSGSPVFSLAQNAIVGMIDYSGGELNGEAQLGFAIPIEKILLYPRGKLPMGRYECIPVLPPNFLTRLEEINKLKRALMSNNHKTNIVGVHGMGGIGKSVLAAALAREEDVRDYFSEGIFWLTLGIEPKITLMQAELAKMIDHEPHAFKDANEGSAFLNSLLADKTCLVILDDVWSAQNVKELLSNLSPNSKILFTTRDAHIITALAVAQEHPLGLLSLDESKKLLADWADVKPASLPSEAHGVIRECGRLPLTLTICGAQIRDGMTWNDLLDALKGADLESIDLNDLGHEQRGVMKSMKVSVDRLDELEKLDKSLLHVAECYRELAVFPPDEAISDAGILTLWAHAHKINGRHARKMLAVLDRMSLLHRNVENRDAKIELHDLQHDYLRAICPNIQALHVMFLDSYRQKTTRGWFTGPDDGYFFQHLAFHLSKAEEPEELKKLLFDYNWMQSKLRYTDVSSLLSDYDYLKSLEDARIIKAAILLSSHVLLRDACQLPGQLQGRLMEQGLPQIQSLLEKMPRSVHGLWLRPLTQSLTPPGGSLIRTLRGHADPVWKVAITPDGKKAVSGSWDKTLKVWDLESGQEIKTLLGHTRRVLAVAITPDGKKVVSGSGDKTLKVWDLETGQVIRTLWGHDGPVWTVAITPDGKKVVSGSGDKTLKVWDLESGLELQTLQGHTRWVCAAAITPDGKKAVSGSWDKTLKVWDLESGQEIKTLLGHTRRVLAVAITPDGEKVVSGSGDTTLKVWNLETGREIRTLRGHDDTVWTVAITPDGEKVVSSGLEDRTLKVWDLETGQEIKILWGHTGRVLAVAVAITSSGKKVVSGSGDKTLKVWDLECDQEIKTFPSHTRRVLAVAITPDGKKAVSGSGDTTLKVWDLETGQEIRILRGHSGPVWTVAITPDGKKVVSGSRDKTLKVWGLESGQEIRILRGHNSLVLAVAITPDGKKVVSGSGDTTLKIWDLESGREIRTLRGHTGQVWTVAITPDGKKVVSGSRDNSLKVWDLETGQEIKTLRGHINFVDAVAIRSDGMKAVSGSDDKTLKVWDLETGQEIQTLLGHTDWVNAVVIMSDGRNALSGSRDSTLKVWNLENGQMKVEFSSDGAITSIALAPDGRTVIAGEVSGRVHFLRLENFYV